MTSTPVKITVLLDNHAKEGLVAEHGLSLWIEGDGRRIVFDTGQTQAFQYNAKRLGIDTSQADTLVLSHGHYDHTGGIPSLIQNGHGRSIRVYAHAGVVKPRYSIHENTAVPIQMPRESMRILDKLPGHQIHWVHEQVHLTDRIGLTGPVPRKTPFEDTGGPFYLDSDGKRPDLIDDDLSLWLNTDEGLVVCTGCCHAGLVNTLNHVRRLNPGLAIRALIGGFHLVSAGKQRLEKTVEALRNLGIEQLIPLHCTGIESTHYLSEALGDTVRYGKAGQTYWF